MNTVQSLVPRTRTHNTMAACVRRLAGTTATWLTVIAVCCLVMPASVQAQCDQQDWTLVDDPIGVYGYADGTTFTTVNASTAWDPDGAGPKPELLIVAGVFTTIGGVPANHIAAWDGMQWLPLGDGITDTMSNNDWPEIATLTVYDGMLIVGGRFQTAGNVTVNNIAAWDGQQWLALGSGIDDSTDGFMLSAAVYNNQLIVGGSFNQAGGVAVNNIAAWDGSTWSTLGTGLGEDSIADSVDTLSVYDGSLIAGGIFENAGTLTVNNLARWDGSTWSAMGSGTNGPVYDMAVQSARLYVGGSFDSIAGTTVSNIASWDGTTWNDLNGGAGPSDYPGKVTRVVVYDGDIIAAGYFLSAGSVAVKHIAAWDGTSWSDMDGGITHSDPYQEHRVSTLTAWNNTLFIGGLFDSVGGVAVRNYATWNGSTWALIGNGFVNTSGYSPVTDLATFDGTLVVGGSFETAGSVTIPYIAQLVSDTWQPLGDGLDGQIGDMLVYNNQLIVGGAFTHAGSTTASHIAAWNGSTWSTLGTGMSGSVSAMVEYQGQLIAGGYFATAGGVTVNSIAAWDGSTWSPLGTGLKNSTLPAGVLALAVCNDILYAGGIITRAGGKNVNYVAAWDGSSWSAVGDGTEYYIYSLTAYNNTLIAAGRFETAGGVTVNSIAAWDGTSWSDLDDGLKINSVIDVPGIVNTLLVHDDVMLAGGVFDVAGNTPVNGVAAWDGTSWSAWGGSLPKELFEFHVHNGTLFAAGRFSEYMPEAWLARWNDVYTIGDINEDCLVDHDDYDILAGWWTHTDCLYSNWCDKADLNEDGRIDMLDVGVLVTHWAP